VLSSEAVSTLDFGKSILFRAWEKLFYLGVHFGKAISFFGIATLFRGTSLFGTPKITSLAGELPAKQRGVTPISFHLGGHYVKPTSFR
jgi:hypothetical protein